MERDKETEVKKRKRKADKESCLKYRESLRKRRNETQRKRQLDTRKWQRERRKRWKQRDKELENNVGREDMRDGGRGILTEKEE